MKYLSSVLLLFIAICCASASQQYQSKWGLKNSTTVDGITPSVYRLQLDLPYKERWSESILAKKQDIIQLIDQSIAAYNYTIGHPYYFEQYIPDFVFEAYDKEFALECRALAELLDVSFTKVVLLQFMYETFAYCTSTVVRDKNGTLYMGRNLDYDFGDVIKRTSVTLEVYKGDELVYIANHILGFLGHHTAFKPGKFSLSLNQRTTVTRRTQQDIIKGLLTNAFYLFWAHHTQVSYGIRYIFEKAQNYTQAVEIISNTKLIAPAYLTICGVEQNEGAVFAMDRDGVNAVRYLNESDWFLVQTNYDWIDPDPNHDNRRTAMEDRLREMKQENLTPEKLYELFTMTPNFNLITIQTMIFSPELSFMNSTVWLN